MTRSHDESLFLIIILFFLPLKIKYTESSIILINFPHISFDHIFIYQVNDSQINIQTKIKSSFPSK